MPKQALTDAFVASLKPTPGKRVDYWDTKTPGLHMRISATGSKTWAVRYRSPDADKQPRLSLGPYPAISLADARKLARVAVAKIAQGEDPSAEKRKRRQRRATSSLRTVEAISIRYFKAARKGRHRKNGKPKRESTLGNEQWCYDRYIKPKFSTDLLGDLTRTDVQDFVDDIADEHSLSSAQLCLVVLRQFFTYAIFTETLSQNPCLLVEVAAFNSRERVLSHDELRAIWNAAEAPGTVEGLRMSRQLGIAIQLAAVTLQRRGEVAGMHVGELDLDGKTWLIPGARTKNKRPHLVPLSDLAVGLIRAATADADEDSTGHVFPSPRKEDSAIKPAALTRAFSRILVKLKIKNARVHDLRRTGSTALTSEAIGIPRFVVSKVLNHSSDTGDGAAVTGVYDRHAYISEKRRALDAWAMELESIVAGMPKPDNVVRIGEK